MTDGASIETKTERLLDLCRSFGSCAVAFSGGVDSTVAAKAVFLALGDQSIAITGNSPVEAEGHLDGASKLAQLIGIRHEVITTTELDDPNYTRNGPDRCYHCKTGIYSQIRKRMEALGIAVLVDGANVDDTSDYRPGIQAASEQKARSVLAECGFSKDDIRLLAKQWELPIWDKPASPCLASRVSYGTQIDARVTTMIDRAEQYVRALGLRVVRARYHDGDICRLEVPPEEIARLCEPGTREALVNHIRGLGFKFVANDLEGFRSGSMNRVLPAATLNSLK